MGKGEKGAREEEGEERERERVGDDIDTLPRSEASGRAAADTNLAIPKLCRSILAGTKRGGARSLARPLSQTFLGLFLHHDTTFIAGRSKSVSLFRGAEIGGEREKGA